MQAPSRRPARRPHAEEGQYKGCFPPRSIGVFCSLCMVAIVVMGPIEGTAHDLKLDRIIISLA